MLKSPVLSTPVQRALAGAAATGGAVQSHNYFSFPSEGAEQSLMDKHDFIYSSEGSDQSFLKTSLPSEGAEQAAGRWFAAHPSEGADQSGHWSGFAYGPSEG